MEAAKNTRRGNNAGFTEGELASLLTALRMAASIPRACVVAGIAVSSLYARMKVDPELRARVDEAREEADEAVISALFTRATKEHDTTAMIFWLKNRQPDKWRDRRELAIGDVQTAAKRYAEQLGVDENEVIALAQQLAGATN